MDMKKKILIIEDDIDMVEAMKVILAETDCQISAEYSPEEGYKKAKEINPDLLILDVMFGSNKQSKGFDYAVKFKQDKTLAHIPILMITAVNIEHPGFNFSSQTSGEFLPIDEFIDKPAQPEDLIRKAKKLLKQKRSKWVNWPDKN